MLQFGHARQVAGAVRGLEFHLRALEFFLDVRRALHRGLLGLPGFFEVRELALERLQRCLELLAPLARTLVVLLLKRLALDFQLDDAPLEAVKDLGL